MFLFPKLGGTLGGHKESSRWITWHSSCPKGLKTTFAMLIQTPPAPYSICIICLGYFLCWTVPCPSPSPCHPYLSSLPRQGSNACIREDMGQGGVDCWESAERCTPKGHVKKHRIITNRYKQATQRIVICSLSKEDGLFVHILNTGSLALASPDMFFVVDHLFWFSAQLLYMYMMYTVCGCSYLVGDAASCFKDPPVLHGFEFGTLQSLERAFKCFKHDSTAPLK